MRSNNKKKDTVKNINLEFLKKHSNTFLENKKNQKIVGAVLLAVVVSLILLETFVFDSNNTKESLDLSNQQGASGNAIETYTVAKKNVSDTIDIMGQIIFKEKVTISSKVTP